MKKNKKYTDKIKLEYLSKWQSSGLSASKFCAKMGLYPSTFEYWRGKYKLDKTSNNNVENFVPIKVLNAPNTLGEIKIFYPNGIQLICPLNIERSQLKNILNL